MKGPSQLGKTGLPEPALKRPSRVLAAARWLNRTHDFNSLKKAELSIWRLFPAMMSDRMSSTRERSVMTIASTPAALAAPSRRFMTSANIVAPS